jgi:hypothetical protein
MGRALKIKKSATVDVGFDNPVSAEPSTGRENDYYGVVGGNTSLSTAAYPVVKVRVFVTGASEADGWIIRQKGSRKFLVTDGTNTGVCQLADIADSSLTAGTMTVSVIPPDSTEIRLARFTNKWGIDFSNNRYLLNFFDVSDNTIIKSGTASNGTVDMVQVDNPNFYG